MDLPDGNWRLSTRGVVYKTDKEKCIECYIDSDFVGVWAQKDADNAENVMLHIGYVTMYMGCPVLCCSNL